VYRTSILAVALAFGAAGCGGGGDESNADTESESPAGIWSGTISIGGNIVNDLSCVVSEDRDVVCIYFDSRTGNLAGGARGTVRMNGTEIKGSGKSYAAPGFVLADGVSTTASITITGGTVSERSTIDADITTLGQSGRISVSYDPLYERGSSLSTVDGVYSGFSINGDSASLSIDPDGSVFSQTQSGCVGNGQVRIIDSRFNAYEVLVSVSSCPGLNGDYSGLAVTADLSSTDDVILFGVFKNDIGIVGAARK